MNAYFCAEDTVGRAVVLRLFSLQPEAHLTELLPRQGGNAAMRLRFPKYCRLAVHYPTLILTDLDASRCAPELRGEWVRSGGLREPLPEKMAFCIAVREIEAWLMADTENFAEFMGVSRRALGAVPENVADPKLHVVQLARASRKRYIREGVPPRPGSGAKVGLEYNAVLEGFTSSLWDLELAAANSTSLSRAIRKVECLGE